MALLLSPNALKENHNLRRGNNGEGLRKTQTNENNEKKIQENKMCNVCIVHYAHYIRYISNKQFTIRNFKILSFHATEFFAGKMS